MMLVLYNLSFVFLMNFTEDSSKMSVLLYFSWLSYYGPAVLVLYGSLVAFSADVS